MGATSWGVNSKLNRAYETIANKVIYIHKKLKNKITTSNILKRQEKVLQRIEKKNRKLRKNYDHVAKFV